MNTLLIMFIILIFLLYYSFNIKEKFNPVQTDNDLRCCPKEGDCKPYKTEQDVVNNKCTCYDGENKKVDYIIGTHNFDAFKHNNNKCDYYCQDNENNTHKIDTDPSKCTCTDVSSVTQNFDNTKHDIDSLKKYGTCNRYCIQQKNGTSTLIDYDETIHKGIMADKNGYCDESFINGDGTGGGGGGGGGGGAGGAGGAGTAPIARDAIESIRDSGSTGGTGGTGGTKFKVVKCPYSSNTNSLSNFGDNRNCCKNNNCRESDDDVVSTICNQTTAVCTTQIIDNSNTQNNKRITESSTENRTTVKNVTHGESGTGTGTGNDTPFVASKEDTETQTEIDYIMQQLPGLPDTDVTFDGTKCNQIKKYMGTDNEIGFVGSGCGRFIKTDNPASRIT